VAAVDGWCSVEELTRWGFARAPVVMANEAHSGLARCIRIRDIGVRMIVAAHQAGVRQLVMEALPRPADGTPGPIRAVPPVPGGYLAQPDMRRLITTALELGWTLWAYEADIQPGDDPAGLFTQEFTNWREREQAQNLCRVLAEAPARPLLVWSGNSHAAKEADGGWVPMGHYFRALSGIDPFVIDQAVTVAWRGRSQPWAVGLLAAIRQTLASYGAAPGSCASGRPRRWMAGLASMPWSSPPATRSPDPCARLMPDPAVRLGSRITDRIMIFGERHLRAVLTEYEAHYNGRRPHRSRQLHPPRPDHPPADLFQKRIKRKPVLGGLINEYERAA
jgi:hypothetical protein